jgi:hypothetical protein
MSEQPWDAQPWDEADGVESDIDGGVLVVAEPTHAVVDIATPLTMDEARELTEHIRSTADVLYVLLGRAHAGRAWEALGYGSFEAYVKEEFNISRSRAYQILNQAKVIEAIEAAVPEGTDLNITEAQARDLKSVLGEVAGEIEERTRDLPANEAAEVVEEIVEDYREQQREKREARAAERAAYAAENGYTGGGEYRPPVAPPTYDEDDEIDAALIRRNVQAAYDLYSSLSALKSMPDVQAVIDTIPVERRMQINDSLTSAQSWLNTFGEQWFAQPWQNGGAESTDSGDLVEDFDEFSDDDFGDEPEV